MAEKKISFLQHYLRGESLFGVWGFATEAVGIFSTLLVISLLDVFKYGTYLLVISFFSLVSGAVLSLLSEVIFNDISRFIAEKKENFAKRLFWETFLIRMILAFFISVAVFLGADLIAYYYDNDVANLLRIISPLFLISTFYTMIRMMLRARLKFGLISFRPMVYEIFRLVFLLALVNFFSLGITEALIAHVSAAFFATAVFVPSFLKYYGPWRKIKISPKMITPAIVRAHGKWSLFSQSIASITADIRPWLIKFFVNTEAVAFFSISESILGIVKVFFPDNTLAALVPKEVSDRKRAAYLLTRGTKYYFIWTSLLAIAAFFLVPVGIKLVFPKYIPSIPLFRILIFTFPIQSLRTLPQAFLFALRKQKFFFSVDVITIALRTITPVLLLSFLGIWGMPIERVMVSLFLTFMMCGYLLKIKIYPIRLREFFIFDKKDKLFLANLWGFLLNRIRRTT